MPLFLPLLVRTILHDLYCPFFSPEGMVKLRRRIRGLFVTLIEIGMRPITRSPGHVLLHGNI